jgi:hypothetical protein
MTTMHQLKIKVFFCYFYNTVKAFIKAAISRRILKQQILILIRHAAT